MISLQQNKSEHKTFRVARPNLPLYRVVHKKQNNNALHTPWAKKRAAFIF